MPLKQLLNTCLSCRTARNREFIYTVSQRPTARPTTPRPVWATCTRLISSWNYHKRRCFTFSIIWRGREHNIWLLWRSKSKVGDSIRNIWCGFKGTKNQKQSMMNMNRYTKIWPNKTLLSNPGIHGPKPGGPGWSGSVLVLGPDQDRENVRNSGRKLQNLRPDWTRTNKILKILDQFSPVSPRNWRAVDTWSDSKTWS